jgi:WD40 repeat protein
MVSTSIAEKNNLKIYQLNSGKSIDLSGHVKTVSDVFYSLDSSKIVSSSFDKTIKVWDASNGQLFHTFERSQTVDGHTDSILLMAPHSKRNIFASCGMDSQLNLWDLDKSELIWNLDSAYVDPKHYFIEIYFGMNKSEDYLYGIRDTPDGGGVLNCWDVTSKSLWQFIDKECVIETFSVSPSGNYLSIGGNNGTAQVIDSKTGKLISNIDKYFHTGKDGVTKISFSQCETYLQTSGDDRLVFVFDIRMGGKLLFKFQHNEPQLQTEEGVTNADWSKTLGTTLLCTSGSDQVVNIWDICSGTGLGVLEGHSDSKYSFVHILAISSVRWSNDDNAIATGADNSILRLYSTDRTKKLDKEFQFYWK